MSNDLSPPTLLPDVLRSRAAIQPEGVGLIVDDVGSLTFRRWEQRSNAFARGLVARGVRPGQRVALRADNCHALDYAVGFFGVLKAGAVAVPVATTTPPPRIDRVLADSDCVAVCGRAGEEPPRSTTPTWSVAEIEEGQEHGPVPPVGDPSDLAQILYTSGTTGVPKGVACSHANLLFGIIVDDPDLADARLTRVGLHALPPAHNAAQVELIRAAHRMATTVILPTFHPERFAALVTEHRATALILVPAMAIMLVNTGVFDRHDASSVRRIRLTGAPAPPALLRRLAEAIPQVEIFNQYASTESLPAGLSAMYDPARPASVGRAEPREAVRIAGLSGETKPANEIGEVWLSGGDAPMRSYFGDPEATAAVFRGGWVRTGDLGYMDDDGFVFLTDRLSDIIIVGGENVSTIEVEAAIHECSAVAEAAVVGIPHEVLGEQVAAAVALRAPTTVADLRAFLLRLLPEHAVPQTVLFVDRLPRNPTGKVLKGELREQFARERAREFIPASTPTERAIATIWAQVLGVESVSVTDRFGDIGGQSISALQARSDIEERLHVSLPPDILNQAETVSALALFIDTGDYASPMGSEEAGLFRLPQPENGALP